MEALQASALPLGYATNETKSMLKIGICRQGYSASTSKAAISTEIFLFNGKAAFKKNQLHKYVMIEINDIKNI